MSDFAGKTPAVAKTNAHLKDVSLEPTSDVIALWKTVHKAMRGEFGEAIFRSWLKPLKLQASYHGTMEISIPTRFMRDWIQTHYAERILSMCQEQSEDIKKVQFVVMQAGALDDELEDEKVVELTANQNLKDAVASIGSALDPRFTFDSFVVGKSNALALSLIHI